MKQFGKFVSVGLLNTAVGYAIIFICMYGIGWGPYRSNVVGYAVGLLFSYVLNRYYTFESSRAKAQELFAFLGVFGLAYAANLGALKLLIDFGADPGLSQVLAGVFYIAISYTANKFLVFR